MKITVCFSGQQWHTYDVHLSAPAGDRCKVNRYLTITARTLYEAKAKAHAENPGFERDWTEIQVREEFAEDKQTSTQ